MILSLIGVFLSNNVEEKILHGTTTVGIKAKDGIILCADMRASAGYFIANNNTMKIQKIDEHAGMTMAGGVADAQNITDILRYHANLHRIEKNKAIPIKSLTRLASLIFHQNRGYPFIADILVGGYDLSGPDLYNIDMFGSVEKKNFVTTGSGSPVAYGLLEEEYHENLSVDEAKGNSTSCCQSSYYKKYWNRRWNQHRNNRQRWISSFDKRTKKSHHYAIVI